MHPLIQRFRNKFITGLMVLIPGIVATWAVVVLFNLITGGIPRLLGIVPLAPVQHFVERNPIVTQLVGLVLILVLIASFGVLATNVIGRQLLAAAEGLLMRVPLFRVVYSTVKQIGVAFSSNKNMFRSVVLFEYPKQNIYVLGFVTAEAFKESRELTGKDLVSVFVPTTPNPTSGFLYFVARNELHFVDMTVANAMRLIISGGVVQPEEGGEPVAVANPSGGQLPAGSGREGG